MGEERVLTAPVAVELVHAVHPLFQSSFLLQGRPLAQRLVMSILALVPRAAAERADVVIVGQGWTLSDFADRRS
jgi:hypothetical protein